MHASEVSGKLFEQLNFRGERQKVISSNIANVNTPEYKTKDLVFSEELKEFYYSIGLEYLYSKQFAVRTGYYYENALKGARKFFTIGAGIKYNVFGLNFSYLVPSGQGVNRNPLSNTLRFGLIFDLDAK